jgi:hypothetical protein
VALAAAPASEATHPRPKSAIPFYAPIVPAFKSCFVPNRQHAAPLSYQSCSPPAQATQWTTVGTGEVNGAAVNSVGSVRLRVIEGPPSDIAVVFRLTDIRCLPDATTCGAANDAGPPDYIGDVMAELPFRITDHNNEAGPGMGGQPGTLPELPFPVHTTCASTGPAIGASCLVTTSLNSVVPNAYPSGNRMLIEIGAVRVVDGGEDGNVNTGVRGLLGVQGIFVP